MLHGANRQSRVGPHQHNLCDAILGHADRTPEKPFSILLGEAGTAALTYGKLREDAMRFASWFSASGVETGSSVIALMIDYDVRLFSAFVGAMLAGAVPAIFPTLSPKQDPRMFWSTHQRVFDRIDPAMILTDDVNIRLLQQHVVGFESCTASLSDLPDTPISDPIACTNSGADTVAFLQHSSGTTGLKKA